MELALPFAILILGLALLGAEDWLPTGGALGILAVVCFLALLYLGFSESSTLGLKYLAVEVVTIPAIYGLSSYLVAKSGLGRAAVLRPPEPHEFDLSREGPDLDRLVGLVGRALSPLRPSGTVEFEGRRLDGVAEAGLIPAGAPVLAVLVRSGRLVVRPELPEEMPTGDE